jgi:hypothetical protein
MSLITQHSITLSVFKLRVLSVDRNLAGYRVRKFLNTKKVNKYYGEMDN